MVRKICSVYMQVYVLPPEDMKFVPQHVEAVVGTELEMPLAVFGQYQGDRLTLPLSAHQKKSF